MFFFAGKPFWHATCYGKGWERHLRKSWKVANYKCFTCICSSIPTSKNKIYIFGKTSTDLAGIIRSLLKFDVKKYHEDSNLFVCWQCFQQLTKYERAAQKLWEIKQEQLTAFRNREQLREKRLARDENRDDLETINSGDVRVSSAKSLGFSTETSRLLPSCRLHFLYYTSTASSVHSCSIKQTSIPVYRNFTHSNQEYCFFWQSGWCSWRSSQWCRRTSICQNPDALIAPLWSYMYIIRIKTWTRPWLDPTRLLERH